MTKEEETDNKTKYTKVTEMDVINMLIRTSESWHGCGCITPSNITSLLKTSRYQVNKHIKSLKLKGLIEYKSILFQDEYDYYPPYNGYCLSEFGRMTFEKELKEKTIEACKLIDECFGK